LLLFAPFWRISCVRFGIYRDTMYLHYPAR
jgi:hypothetical protein